MQSQSPPGSSSICKDFGKDKIIWYTKEDYDRIPDRFERPVNNEVSRPFLENGDINWECRCLGSMPVGPCGVPFRDSYSCLRNSTADPPGSDCIDSFNVFTECIAKYPQLYAKHFGKDDDFEEDEKVKDFVADQNATVKEQQTVSNAPLTSETSSNK